MNSLNLNEFQKDLDRKNLLMLFDGYMSQGILCNLVETLKERFDIENEKYNSFITKKIYGVFIELAQNVQNYSKQSLNNAINGRGRMSIREDNEFFYIESKNRVNTQSWEELQGYFDQINDLDEKEVRKLYKKKLHEDRKEGHGAGLGFLEIRKKTKNTINYAILDDNLTISVKINKA